MKGVYMCFVFCIKLIYQDEKNAKITLAFKSDFKVFVSSTTRVTKHDITGVELAGILAVTFVFHNIESLVIIPNTVGF